MRGDNAYVAPSQFTLALIEYEPPAATSASHPQYIIVPTGSVIMRKQVFRSIFVGGLSAIAIMLGQQNPAWAVDGVKTIQIVLNAQGHFEFSQKNVKIKVGDSIKWVPNNSFPGAPHQLVGDTANDHKLFKDTDRFDSTNPPTRKFNSPGRIHYHCIIHPATLKGTITVQSTGGRARSRR